MYQRHIYPQPTQNKTEVVLVNLHSPHTHFLLLQGFISKWCSNTT